MKKALLMAVAACAVFGFAGIASANSPDSSDFKINGDVELRYRADTNTHDQFGNGTNDGMRYVLTLNMTQKLADNFNLYARYSYMTAPADLVNTFGADVVSNNGKTSFSTVDQYGLDYKNAGWKYKLGAQSLSLGATGLLYDDRRYFGPHIFNNALNASGKVGDVNVNAVIAESNYGSGLENDKIYYAHGSLPVNRSTFGLGYARANYGSATALGPVENNATGVNYYTGDFGYKLADDLFFHSEFIKSSAADNNKGINLVLFHIIDAKNNGGIAWFHVEGQAALQQESQGNMTYQWGNAQGAGFFFNHKITKDITFSVVDFKMKQIAPLTFAPGGKNPSGMPGDQNTLRVDLAYKF